MSSLDNTPRVSIIVLNWNNWQDTVECIESLYKISYPNYDVIVIDNGSKNDSVQRIKDYCLGKIEVKSRFFEYDRGNKPIEVFEVSEEDAEKRLFDSQFYESYRGNKLILIKNKKNYGFAKGNNIGIKFALEVLKPEYVLLLNNDTVVSKSFLNELVGCAIENRAEILGPKIYYYDYKGRDDVISFTGEDIVPFKGGGQRYGDREVDRGQWDRPFEPDRLEGSCMLIKREVFERIGLFDERYFAYYEETDFCVRAKRTGFKIMYCPTAKIWHKVGASLGRRASPMRMYLSTRNRTIFVRRNFPEELWKHALYIIFYDFWRRLGVETVYRRSPLLILFYLRGLIDGWRAILDYGEYGDRGYRDKKY